VGEFADDLHAALRDALAARDDTRDWQTEWYAGRTPVDVAGVPDAAPPADGGGGPLSTAGTDAPLLLVEVEVRRADPANNAVKLARHASEGAFDRPVRLAHVFTDYYALDSGGVSSKRANAAFVGDLAADALDAFAYEALSLPVTPPKRGSDPPAGWRDAVETLAEKIA
jgi:hypothetical protein